MDFRDSLKGILRTSIAFLLALAGLGAIVAVYLQLKEFNERERTRPYETVRDWQSDLIEKLKLRIQVRTKLVEGTLMVYVDVDGYPTYLSDPRNRNRSLIVHFLDKDGFKVATRAIEISEFTTTVDSSGMKTGLQHQYEESLDVERYKRFDSMHVGWNLITEGTPKSVAPKSVLDHCAPELSKAERLRRLAQHGAVRETGIGGFATKDHSVTFLYDGSLLSCH